MVWGLGFRGLGFRVEGFYGLGFRVKPAGERHRVDWNWSNHHLEILNFQPGAFNKSDLTSLATAGYLSPYHWSLLVIFFLQALPVKRDCLRIRFRGQAVDALR